MNQSQTENTTTTTNNQSTARIAFIQANWHSHIVDVCRQSFCAELGQSDITEPRIDTFDVPGSFEIPLLAKKLAQSGLYDVIVAAGLVTDGGIYRHEFVANAVIDAMMRVQIECEVPVISAVLTPHQFHEHGEHHEFFAKHFEVKGVESAQACVQTLKNMRNLEGLMNAA